MVLNENFFFTRLKKLECFENRPYICVGVSGGPDSIALTYLLSKWVRNHRGKLIGLIFNHKLRENSEDEAKLVRGLLKKMDVSSKIITPKKNKLIKKNMSQARLNRYDGLLGYCKKNNITHLFLGHHLDDNLETFLMRRISGSNIDGLSCMTILTNFNFIRLYRPLINIDKNSIIKFNKKNNLEYINDPSNTNFNYTRVQVRSFLKNKYNKKQALSEFRTINKHLLNYKKMILEIFINNFQVVSSNLLKVKFDYLAKHHDLIIEKHMMMILRFFSNHNYKTRSSKIKLLITELNKPNFKSFNISGVIAEKSNDFLEFSRK